MKRFQARRGNGRFVRNTPENTLGMHIDVHERKADGSWCGAMIPTTVGEQRPEKCHACGEALVQASETYPVVRGDGRVVNVTVPE